MSVDRGAPAVLAVTTFGTAQHAQQAVDRIRAANERVRSATEAGEPYRAAGHDLLGRVRESDGR
ncbi:oxygenase MpaB family protein [Streptomyces avidinii]